MTLIYELDLDIPKMYLYSVHKNELLRFLRLSKVRALQTDRQAGTQTDATEDITTPQCHAAFAGDNNNKLIIRKNA